MFSGILSKTYNGYWMFGSSASSGHHHQSRNSGSNGTTNNKWPNLESTTSNDCTNVIRFPHHQNKWKFLHIRNCWRQTKHVSLPRAWVIRIWNNFDLVSLSQGTSVEPIPVWFLYPIREASVMGILAWFLFPSA